MYIHHTEIRNNDRCGGTNTSVPRPFFVKFMEAPFKGTPSCNPHGLEWALQQGMNADFSSDECEIGSFYLQCNAKYV